MIKQPERSVGDGEVWVRRHGVGNAYISIHAESNGNCSEATMGEYNAWRAFGMLATILGIKLPKNIAKQIKF